MNAGNCRFLLATAALTAALAGCSSVEKNVALPPAPAPAPVAVPAPSPPPRMVYPPAPTYVEGASFEHATSNLKPAATGPLDRVASELRVPLGVHYDVAAFTDSVGSDAWN